MDDWVWVCLIWVNKKEEKKGGGFYQDGEDSTASGVDCRPGCTTGVGCVFFFAVFGIGPWNQLPPVLEYGEHLE